LARKFIKKIIYSAENIKICFISRQNPVDFGNSKSPALQKQDGAERLGGEKENPISLQNNKFVFERLAPELKSSQTFTIILPNLIHKSKKRNLT